MTTIRNPAYEGQEPRPLHATCHDGTPFLSVVCRCGAELHLHESQLAAIPSGATVLARSPTCGHQVDLDSDELRLAFRQMRSEGWIAEVGR